MFLARKENTIPYVHYWSVTISIVHMSLAIDCRQSKNICVSLQHKICSSTLTLLSSYLQNKRVNFNLMLALYLPLLLLKYMNLHFKYFISLLIHLFIGNWLLIEQCRFRGPWLCITNRSINFLYRLRYTLKRLLIYCSLKKGIHES